MLKYTGLVWTLLEVGAIGCGAGSTLFRALNRRADIKYHILLRNLKLKNGLIELDTHFVG